MIRDYEIRKACRELASMQRRVNTLTKQMGFSISKENIAALERALNRVNAQIEEKEHEIKIMKGLTSPLNIRPWQTEREETRLEAFLGAV